MIDWHMGTHLRVLRENYPMNTNMTGFKWAPKYLPPYALEKSSLSIGRVKVARLRLAIPRGCLVHHIFFREYLPRKHSIKGFILKPMAFLSTLCIVCVASTWVAEDGNVKYNV